VRVFFSSVFGEKFSDALPLGPSANFFWGRLSDRIGRKPVILFGTLATAACFVAFGFCRTLWQAIVVQAIMGLVNGNAGVLPLPISERRVECSRLFNSYPRYCRNCSRGDNR